MKASVINSSDKDALRVLIFQDGHDTIEKSVSPKATLSVDIPPNGSVSVTTKPKPQ